MGYPIFVGLRGMDRPELAGQLKVYRDALKAAGRPGDGDVILRLPVYVAETEERARSEAEASTMSSYRRMAQSFAASSTVTGTTVSEERAERGRRQSEVTYDDLLRDRVAYGTPEAVADRIEEIRGDLQPSGIIAEINVGGLIPRPLVFNSLRLFGERVISRFR